MCLTATILDSALAKRDQSPTNQAALIGMKFADEAVKSRATRRSSSTCSSSGSAVCLAGKVERRLVMIGVRLPEEGGPVGTIFPPASFGNHYGSDDPLNLREQEISPEDPLYILARVVMVHLIRVFHKRMRRPNGLLPQSRNRTKRTRPTGGSGVLFLAACVCAILFQKHTHPKTDL